MHIFNPKEYTVFNINVNDITNSSYYNPKSKRKFNVFNDDYYKSFNESDFNVLKTDDDIRNTPYYKLCMKTKLNLLKIMMLRFEQFKKMNIVEKDLDFNYDKTIIIQIRNYIDINNKIKQGEKIDPIELSVDSNNKLYLFDGIHRFILYTKNKSGRIPVVISALDSCKVQNDIVAYDNQSCNIILPKSQYNLVRIDDDGMIHTINKINTDNKCRIIHRSRGWIKYRNSLPNKPYQIIQHPDLIFKSGHRNDSRIDLINTKIDIILPDKNREYLGLDVGCSYGMFCRFFSKLNVKMTGLDFNADVIRRVSYLNKYFGTDINYERADVINWVEKNKNKKFDVIVCLSIIHNIIQSGKKQKALHVLKTLSKMGKCMIFDIGEEREKGDQVSKLKMDLKKEKLQNFIETNTVYKNIVLLGKETGYCGRNLYLLY